MALTTRNWPRNASLGRFLLVLATLATTATQCCSAFEYAVDSVGEIRLDDVTTNISDIFTLLRDSNATVHVEDVAWKASNITDSAALRSARLAYYTYMNGELVAAGSYDLNDAVTVPPSTVAAGSVLMDSAGRHNLTVQLQVEYDSEFYSNKLEPVASTRFYQTYRAWVSIFPVLVLFLLAWQTGNVEISLSTANLVSVCIIQGNFFRGSNHMVQCLLNALISPENGVIILVVFFLGGIMSMIEVSGGVKGFVDFFGYYLRTARVVQCIACGLGLCYFWDDTFSMLIMGFLMRPLLDHASTSRPLTAMIIDATAGPITSLVAVSTWMTWEIPLLQQELNRLDLDEASASLLKPNQVFQQSLRYAYYPIFFILLMPLLLWTQRHIGPLLIAERTTQVYKRKDGGPEEYIGPGMTQLPVNPGTTCRFWNSCIPLGLISLLFVVYALQTGANAANRDLAEGETVNWLDLVVNTSVEEAWLQSISMGAALYVVALLLQWQQNGNVLLLPLNIGKIRQQKKQLKEEEEAPIYDDEGGMKQVTDEEDIMKPIMPMMTIIRSFFFGFSQVMPYVIQFILAWAVRQGFSDLGLDRWIATSLAGKVDTMEEGRIPTIAFFVAFLMSFFTGGASKGRVASILLPLLVKPVFEATYVSDPNLFYQVIGAVFSGCVAGDHASPVSNTTLLSMLSTDCHLKAHVETQLPYIVFVVAVSVLFGTLPVGYGSYPNGVCYGLGIVALVLFVLFVCVPVLDTTGEWDIFTKLYLRVFYGPSTRSDEELEGFNDNPFDELQRATSKAAGEQEEEPLTSSNGEEFPQHVMSSPDSKGASITEDIMVKTDTQEDDDEHVDPDHKQYDTQTSTGTGVSSVEVTAHKPSRKR